MSEPPRARQKPAPTGTHKMNENLCVNCFRKCANSCKKNPQISSNLEGYSLTHLLYPHTTNVDYKEFFPLFFIVLFHFLFFIYTFEIFLSCFLPMLAVYRYEVIPVETLPTAGPFIAAMIGTFRLRIPRNL